MESLLFDGQINSGVRTMAEAGHGVDYAGGNGTGSKQFDQRSPRIANGLRLRLLICLEGLLKPDI
jgi:hypothetical protein